MYSVYKVLNLTTGKVYIGSSSDPQRRKKDHLTFKNPHTNKGILADREKGHKFEFIILKDDISTKKEALKAEEHLTRKSEKDGEIYNINYGASISDSVKLKMSKSALGPKNPMYGKELSSEHKQKLREATIKNGNQPPSWKDKKHSEASKIKMAKNCAARKLSDEIVMGLLQRYYGIDGCYKNIADVSPINRSQVKDLLNGKTYRHVFYDFMKTYTPEKEDNEYKKLMYAERKKAYIKRSSAGSLAMRAKHENKK